MIVCVHIQHRLPRRSGPLGRDRDKLENEGLDTACCLESELLHLQSLHDEFIEVAYECREQKEDRVFCHEGFWQSVPSESARHVIEDTLLSSAKVIEFDNLSHGRPVVVCHDAAVGVFTLPQVKLTVRAPLPLNDKTARLSFPFLNKNGIQLKHRAVDLLRLPPPERKDVLIERAAAVGTDVERLAMLLHLLHYFFRARPTVCPEAVDCNIVALKPLKDSPQRILLVETHIGVSVAVLYADNHVPYNGNARAVSEKLLVCRLGVILLRLKELVVEVNVILPARFQLPGGQQTIQK